MLVLMTAMPNHNIFTGMNSVFRPHMFDFRTDAGQIIACLLPAKSEILRRQMGGAEAVRKPWKMK
jgi:hypothetical protein